MRIKFKKPDPRAGLVALMDSKRGQQLVSEGAAVQVNEDGSEFGESAQAAPRAQLNAALVALPGEYTDPDFVVAGMRSHFGEVFTYADEKLVRALVLAPGAVTTEAGSPSANELGRADVALLANAAAAPVAAAARTTTARKK